MVGLLQLAFGFNMYHTEALLVIAACTSRRLERLDRHCYMEYINPSLTVGTEWSCYGIRDPSWNLLRRIPKSVNNSWDRM